MGIPMARNLLRAGYQLHVYARKAALLEEFTKLGARACNTPASAAANADCFISIVSDSPDVETVLTGPDGAIHGLKKNSVVIDMSTISPQTTQTLAAQLAEKSIDMLDAPVSGGEAGAINGTLSIMVGGNSETLKRVMPVLRVLGNTIVHIGANGAGQTAKMCNQMVITQTIAAVAEAMEFARASGVDETQVRTALLGGSAQSQVLEVYGRRLLERDFTPGFKIALLHKDLKIASATAAAMGLQLQGLRTAFSHVSAAVDSGRGELDCAVMMEIVQESSHTH